MPSDSNTQERLPPQNRDAERSVLGSMLRDNTVIERCRSQILQGQYDSFYSDAHQQIYQAMITLYDKVIPVDLVTLAEDLHQTGPDRGHRRLLPTWPSCGMPPHGGQRRYYAEIVRDRAMVRHLIHASTEILRDAYDQAQPADELVAEPSARSWRSPSCGMTGETYTLAEAIAQAYERIDQRHQGDEGDRSAACRPASSTWTRSRPGLQNSEN